MLIDNSNHKYYIAKVGIGSILQSLIEYVDDMQTHGTQSQKDKLIEILENAYDIYMEKDHLQC